MEEDKSDAQPAGNTTTGQTKKQKVAAYQKQYAQANREKLLARRRQLYAEGETRKQKDKEYYLKVKDTPEYKQRTREASLRWFHKNRKPETEEEKRARYRRVGKLLAERHKEVGSTRVTKKDTSWLDAIPDLTQSWGALPEIPENFVRLF
jgi:hypothetical protein